MTLYFGGLGFERWNLTSEHKEPENSTLGQIGDLVREFLLDDPDPSEAYGVVLKINKMLRACRNTHPRVDLGDLPLDGGAATTALNDFIRLAAQLPPPPWVPDIDDPGKETEAWTGKWTVNGGSFGYWSTEAEQCLFARWVAAARVVSATMAAGNSE